MKQTDNANNKNRQLFNVPLAPLQGSRFAPTGFADLGAATFDRPSGENEWTKCLLVESAQSMANRLEAALWDQAAKSPVPLIERLPYVKIVDEDGQHLTSSREESHRLASAYIREALIDGKTGSEWLVDHLELKTIGQIDYRRLAVAVFSIDPLALVHGVFFAGKGSAEFPGQPKFTRLTTAFIEADDVRPAESGGVKRDIVSPTQEASGGDSTDGKGSIPFSRTEWTARSITGYFNIDLAQLRSFGLPQPAQDLLLRLSQLEIASLLAQPLRLRTNCDLEVVDGADLVDRTGDALPSIDELSDLVAALIDECSSSGLLGDVVEGTWARPKKK